MRAVSQPFFYRKFSFDLESSGFELVSGLYKTTRQVFNYFLSGSRRFANYYISQGKLASLLGISRRQLIRHINILREKGLLIVRSRGFKRSCSYKINSYYFKGLFWGKATGYKTVFYRKVRKTVTSIKAALEGISQKNVTLLKEDDKYTTHTTGKRGLAHSGYDQKRSKSMAYEQQNKRSRHYQGPEKGNSYKNPPKYPQWELKQRVELPKEKADYRQQEHKNNPEVVEGFYKLAKIVGKEAAREYFKKSYDNLRFEIKEKK